MLNIDAGCGRKTPSRLSLQEQKSIRNLTFINRMGSYNSDIFENLRPPPMGFEMSEFGKTPKFSRFFIIRSPLKYIYSFSLVMRMVLLQHQPPVTYYVFRFS